jgi:hypothetical protein
MVRTVEKQGSFTQSWHVLVELLLALKWNITNATKQSPYTEADGRSATWEILFLEPKIYYFRKKARLTPQMELSSTPIVK